MKKINQLILLGAAIALLASCSGNRGDESKTTETMASSTAATTGISSTSWGTQDEKPVNLYTLTNASGAQVSITNYGGTVTSWKDKDKTGKLSSIVVGFDNLDGYLLKPPYFGAIIGRFGNRIANGVFKIDGHTYTLAKNDGPNHLHGGDKGFDKVVWDATIEDSAKASLVLSYLSKDGEEGYPGNLKITVRYTFTDDNELEITYDAETDKATPINLTNHSYFNLTGTTENTILDHTLMIDADNYTPVSNTLIPTGKIEPVAGTPFDFKEPTKIGARIDQVPGGYDHNYVLNKKEGFAMVAYVTDSVSGRKLEVYTDEPGLQFYSGNFLDGTFKTAEGSVINKHTALCLETQHFPDSPNQTGFPNTILKPGEKYHTVTKYKLSVQ